MYLMLKLRASRIEDDYIREAMDILLDYQYGKITKDEYDKLDKELSRKYIPYPVS